MTDAQGTTTQAPQEAQGAPHERTQGPMDSTDEARRFLATLEAEIREGQQALARTLHEGHEHFRKGMEKATQGMKDADLDNWTHQAAAMARVESAAGNTRAAAPKKS